MILIYKVCPVVASKSPMWVCIFFIDGQWNYGSTCAMFRQFLFYPQWICPYFNMNLFYSDTYIYTSQYDFFLACV